MRIDIAPGVAIESRELSFSFIHATGPGGQNVNKVATAVQLRFDARLSPSLSPEVKTRLQILAGRRLTREGVIVISAREHRTQERNRKDALDKLGELIRAALYRAPRRRPTTASYGERQRRLEAKGQRSAIKHQRRAPVFD